MVLFGNLLIDGPLSLNEFESAEQILLRAGWFPERGIMEL